MTYFGEYNCKIDSKGRLRLPSHLIRQMQGGSAYQFVIHRGFDNSLFMYERHIWDKKVEDFNQLSVYNQKEREFMRYFLRGATVVTMDNADRVLLSKRQMEFAGIKNELVVAASLDRIEFWNPGQYDKIMDAAPEDINQLADDVDARLKNLNNSEE